MKASKGFLIGYFALNLIDPIRMWMYSTFWCVFVDPFGDGDITALQAIGYLWWWDFVFLIHVALIATFVIAIVIKRATPFFIVTLIDISGYALCNAVCLAMNGIEDFAGSFGVFLIHTGLLIATWCLCRDERSPTPCINISPECSTSPTSSKSSSKI